LVSDLSVRFSPISLAPSDAAHRKCDPQVVNLIGKLDATASSRL
jgi:hypothetical protein